mgnify:CR=1 FL=1
MYSFNESAISLKRSPLSVTGSYFEIRQFGVATNVGVKSQKKKTLRCFIYAQWQLLAYADPANTMQTFKHEF